MLIKNYLLTLGFAEVFTFILELLLSDGVIRTILLSVDFVNIKFWAIDCSWWADIFGGWENFKIWAPLGETIIKDWVWEFVTLLLP